MEVDLQKLRQTALEVISGVVEEGALDKFTYGTFRKKVEETMSLDSGTLNAPEYKSVVHTIAKDYISQVEQQNEDEEHETKNKAKATKSPPKEEKLTKPRNQRSISTKMEDRKAAPKKVQKGKKLARSASVVPSSEDEAEPRPTQVKPNSQKKSAASSKRIESGQEDSEADISVEPPTKRQKITTPQRDEMHPQAGSSSAAQGKAVRAMDDKDESGEKSESEMSVLIDEPVVRKRKKKGESAVHSSSREKGAKGRKRKEPAKQLSKEEETIKRLKSLVVACGVRKVWSKEFKDLDKPSDQIRRLREILGDLGMKGRYSMEQAKAIKEKREFEQELEDVKEFAQKMESAGRRRSASITEEQALDDSDIGVPPKRRLTARQSIMAFLGDEDESD